MKGTATLVLGETYNDRKAFTLSCIVTARGLIKTIKEVCLPKPELRDLALQIIKQEQEYIKSELAELTELERWRRKVGLEKDEPFSYEKIRSKNS